MEKYKNKYRIASTRAQWWDYGWDGGYFITICTKAKVLFFGDINHGKMELSPLGVIADILWKEIPAHFNFVELGDFVVMPNHIHGILILDKPKIDPANPHVETLRCNVSTPSRITTTAQVQSSKNEQMSCISPKAGSISTIVRSYKSAVTKQANLLGLENGWQARFHDHIIRNNAEYQRISDYIMNNPANWQEDKFYTEP